jgi:hypothetical protein
MTLPKERTLVAEIERTLHQFEHATARRGGVLDLRGADYWSPRSPRGSAWITPRAADHVATGEDHERFVGELHSLRQTATRPVFLART